MEKSYRKNQMLQTSRNRLLILTIARFVWYIISIQNAINNNFYLMT